MDRDDQIMLFLGEMKGDIKALLAGQEKQNGRLVKHDEAIAALNTFKDNAGGKMTVIGSMWGVVSGILASMAVWFFTRSG
jgi:hypothetical protein